MGIGKEERLRRIQVLVLAEVINRKSYKDIPEVRQPLLV